jgi:erythromycin esterase
MHKLKILVLIILITSFQSVKSQNKELIISINSSLIDIDNSNPEYPFKELSKLQDIFQNVKIFGFGEATHGTKEFQDLKVKFFKYLVSNCNVRTFAIEANYGDCLSINSYIKDGEKGNPKDILSKIGYWVWNTNEIVSLIEWMKLYNSTQTKENQLSFIGIDVMNCQNASNILYKYLQSSSSPDSQKYLTILNSYISQDNLKNLIKKEFEEHYLILKSLESELKHLKDPYLWQLSNSILQYISMRINYTESNRDKLMFENVNWLVENSNIFICAHNTHIKKNNISFTSLGNHLKNKYAEKYYSAGFDFGSGSFNAWDLENNKLKKYSIDEPLKKTSTEVFNNASSDMYFLDFNKSSLSPLLNNFLMSKVFYRGIGSTYSPKMVQKEKLKEAFDGIIFVKKTSESSLLN